MTAPHLRLVLAHDVDTLVRLAMSNPLTVLECTTRGAQRLEMQIDAHVIVTQAPGGLSFAE